MADEALLPKEGQSTSSFKLAMVAAAAPLALAVVLGLAAAFSPYPDAREGLMGVLKYAVIPSIIGAAGVAMQYINGRSKVSVAKMDAYSAINAAPQTTQAAGTQINVTQPGESQ